MRASVTVVHVDVLPFGWHCGVSSFLCWFVYFLPPSSSRRDLLVYFLMTKCPWMLSKGHVSWLPSWSPDVHWGIRWLQPCLSGVLQQWDSGYRWNLASEREKKRPKYDEHCSTVMWLKQLSRLFCVVSLTCQFLAVSLFGAWPFLFLKTKYKQWRKKQPLYFSE